MKMPIYMLLALLGGVSFGLLSTFVKFAYAAGFSPGEVVGTQYVTGTVMLLLIILFMKKRKLSSRTVVNLLLSGIPMAGSGLCYYQSLKYLDASIGIIMLFQFSWMGLIFEWVLDKRRPDREKLLSVVMLFAGSLLAVNILNGSSGSLSSAGIAWGLLAALSFTTFIFVSGRVGIEVQPLMKSLLMSIGALLIVSIVFPPKFLFDGSLFGEGLIHYGLFLGLFGVVLPPLLFSISMPKIGSGLGTILSASELPTAMFMSMAVLKEHVTFFQWFGVLVVLMGIAFPFIADWYRERKKQLTADTEWSEKGTKASAARKSVNGGKM